MPESSYPDYLPKSVRPYFGHLLNVLTPEQIRTAIEPFRSELEASKTTASPLPDSALHWETWLKLRYPLVCSAPFAERHTRLWEWFESLTPNVKPRPRVEVWPRGGAKSMSAELGCVRACVCLSRRFVLYVSGTQEQA